MEYQQILVPAWWGLLGVVRRAGGVWSLFEGLGVLVWLEVLVVSGAWGFTEHTVGA